MKNEGIYRADELVVLPWQYTVRNDDTSDFRIGEKVFLRSDPKMSLEVVNLTKYEVGVEWKDLRGKTHCAFFSPQVLLQYRYAGLMTLNGEFKFCWN